MNSNILPDISIVVPLYNESKVINPLLKRLDNLKKQIDGKVEIILVDDGSTDETALLIKEKALQDRNYHSIFLSRNYGHQLAVSAGLAFANGITGAFIIDGDLQDPPELLSKFLAKHSEGYDVVYGIRKKRKEAITKRFFYFLFYRLLRRISDIDLPVDSGDFCFISKRVVNILNSMPEPSRYLRGMRSWIGFKQVGLEYERAERQAGEPKYNFNMLLKLAYNGLFNFSQLPIKFLSFVGLLSIGVSSLFFIYSLIMKFSSQTVPSGFTALLFIIIMFAGVQLLSIGILGEYIIRIFIQSKDRPLYLISERVKDSRIIVEEY